MLIFALLALALTTATQFDAAGRKAYAALREFTRIELVAFHTHQPWPDAEQHRQITATLDIARETVDDSLTAGVAISAGQPMTPQIASLLRQQSTIFWHLSPLLAQAPKEAKAALRKAQEAFDALVATFPPVADLDHPPAVKR